MQLSLLKQQLNNKLATRLPGLLSPHALALIANHIPEKINQKLIEFFLNQAFEEQVNDGDFDFLEGEQLLVEITDAKIFVGISCVSNRLACTYFHSVTTKSSAILSLNTFDAIQLIEQVVDPDTLFFQRRLKIQGNTELAHQAKNTIDTLDQKRIPDFIMKIVSFYKRKFALTSTS